MLGRQLESGRCYVLPWLDKGQGRGLMQPPCGRGDEVGRSELGGACELWHECSINDTNRNDGISTVID